MSAVPTGTGSTGDQRGGTAARVIGRQATVAIDVAMIVVFAAFGRLSHDGNLDPAGIGRIAAPFLLGLGAAWLLLSAPPLSALAGRGAEPQWYARWRFGVPLALLTVTIGMVLRRLLWSDGTAAAFVVVAVLFVSAILVGWRLVVATNG